MVEQNICKTDDRCPESEIRFLPNLISVSLFLLSLVFVVSYATEARQYLNGVRTTFNINAGPDILIALGLMVILVVPMLIDDLIEFQRRRAKLDIQAIDWQIVLVKVIGVWSTLLTVGGIYWLLPEYGSWYERFWHLLQLVLPPVFVLVPFYVSYTSRYQEQQKDSYYFAGAAVMGIFIRQYWLECRAPWLYEHLRQWLVKGFFLPLMTIFFFNNVTELLDFNYSRISDGFKYLFDFSQLLLFTIDVILAAVGYFFTFKLLKTEIRSVEPSLLGWVVCLMCYPPFWNGLFGEVYLSYDNGYYWGQWLSGSPVFYVLWGSAILVLITLYVLATVSLGYRFSNLTYRGLATSGVYRLTKHPAYITKNLSWWLISIPFIVQGDWGDMIRSCLLLCGVNYIYYLRAKTEERHLSYYPEYVEYAEWINRNGLLRWLGQIFPALKYDKVRLLKSGNSPWWYQK